MATRRGQAERRVVADVAVLLVGVALAEQQLAAVEAAGLGGGGQGGVLVALGLGLDVGAVEEEEAEDGVVAERGGEDQGREALAVAVLDVRAPLHEQARQLLVAARARHRQRRVARRLGARVQVDVRSLAGVRLALQRLLDEVGGGGGERRRWRRQPVI